MSRSPSPTLPNSGYPVSQGVPDTFDFAGHKAELPEIEDYTLTMQERHDLNLAKQARNRASRVLTTNCKNDRAAFPDVGPAIEAYYAYSPEEIMECYALRFSWATFPESLLTKVAVIDVKYMTKKMEKHVETKPKAALLGPRAYLPLGLDTQSAMPDAVLGAIGLGVYPPLSFLSNHYLLLLSNTASLPTITLASTKFTDSSKAPKVLDYTTLIRRNGFPNDIYPGEMTYSEWLQNSQRLVDAIKARTDYSIPMGPGECYLDVELARHFQFFAKSDDAEKTFPHWFHFERHTRYQILGGKAFSEGEYGSQWHTERSDARKNPTSYRSPWAPGGSMFKAGLGYDGGSVAQTGAYTQVGVTRPHPQTDHGPRKAPRTAYNTWAGAPAVGAPAAPAVMQPPQPQNPPAGPAGGRGAFRASAPSCLCCAEEHLVSAHVVGASNTWKDNTPRFATVIRSELGRASLVRASDNMPICFNYNIKAGKCALPDGHDGGRLHLCAWCGGPHPAFSRDGGCARVVNGRAVP